MVKLHPLSNVGLRKVSSNSNIAQQQLGGASIKLICDDPLRSAPPSDVIAGRFRIMGTASIGDGSGGEVWKALDLETNSEVALKRLNQRRFKERLREAAASTDPLLAKHPLLVPPLTVVEDERWSGSSFVSSAHQPCGDLRNSLHASGPLTLKTARAAIADLLIALNFLHTARGICHRDVKPENIYYDATTLRLGDFGLARRLPNHDERGACDGEPQAGMTPQMVTLWYRSPEVLLGARDYGFSVDIFSAGAVFGELLAGKPLFKGTTEIDQLSLVFTALGKPSTDAGSGWSPELTAAIESFQVSSAQPSGGGGGSGGGGFESAVHEPRWRGLAELLPFGTPAPAIDLMSKLLAVNPRDRPSARSALSHPFFWEEPKVAVWRKQQASALAAAATAALQPLQISSRAWGNDTENTAAAPNLQTNRNRGAEESEGGTDSRTDEEDDDDDEEEEEEEGEVGGAGSQPCTSSSSSSSSSALQTRVAAQHPLMMEPNRITLTKSKLKKRRHHHVFVREAPTPDSSRQTGAPGIPRALLPYANHPKKRP